MTSAVVRSNVGSVVVELLLIVAPMFVVVFCCCFCGDGICLGSLFSHSIFHAFLVLQ